MGTSKILIDGVGIDLTADTVAANKMLSGTKAHDSNGDSVTGNIASKAAATYTPTTADQTIAAGQYLSGAQTIKGDANLVAGNIASGVSIFGVTGTHAGQKPEQTKTLTLGAAAPSTVTPDSGKVLSSVPVTIDTSVIKAENIAKDVTILGITGTHEGGGGAPLGSTWTAFAQANAGFACGNGIVVDYTNKMASSDGINFSPISFPENVIKALVFGMGKFVAISGSARMYYSSDNCVTWQEGNFQHTSGINYDDISCSCYYADGKFVFLMSDLYDADDDEVLEYFYSLDGQSLIKGTSPNVTGGAFKIAYLNGRFVAGRKGNRYIYILDKTNTWTRVSNGTIKNASVIEVDGTLYFLAENGVYATEDLSTFRQVYSSTLGTVGTIAYLAGTIVLVYMDNNLDTHIKFTKDNFQTVQEATVSAQIRGSIPIDSVAFKEKILVSTSGYIAYSQAL